MKEQRAKVNKFLSIGVLAALISKVTKDWSASGDAYAPVFFLFLRNVIYIIACSFERCGANSRSFYKSGYCGRFSRPVGDSRREDYYATATSGGWSPEFPIMHSTDLIN